MPATSTRLPRTLLLPLRAALYVGALMIGIFLMQGYDHARFWVGEKVNRYLVAHHPSLIPPATFWKPPWYLPAQYADPMFTVAYATLYPAGWLILAAVVVSGLLFMTTRLGHGLPLLIPMLALPWLSFQRMWIPSNIPWYPRGTSWDTLSMLAVWSLVLIVGWWLFVRRFYLTPPPVEEIDLTPREIAPKPKATVS